MVPDPPPAGPPEVAVRAAEAQVVDDPETVQTGDLEVFLILGSDARPNKESVRADAVMLLITDRRKTLLVSIPRRLNVISPCSGELAPVNTNLEGCGDVSGLDLTAIAVEDYTGLSINHLVMFGFDGFTSIIDRIGGLEVCVENPVKLRANAPVFLEAGCSTLDGAMALPWVRSRMTLELVDSQWTLMEGAGDASRTERQREMVLVVLQRLHEFDSPGTLNSVVRELADSFILDSGWGLAEAVSLAWDLRSISARDFRSTAIEAEGTVTPDGDFVLEPTGSFSDVLKGMFG
jgi:LCP family protein required for cell wall assembly